MRDLIVTENITLDGVVDASAGWFSVADDAEVDQSDLVAALGEQSQAADAVLFGRVTFEEMRGYWPRQTDDTTGGITLVHALIAAGLVDEYRLFVYPVVLGRGERLFPDGAEVPRLGLVETRPFRSGVVLLRYRPA
jgi:dihydrofolate reductase